MPEQSITTQINYYLGLVKNYRWLLIGPFCIAMVVGIYFAITLPKMYEAETLILVTPQRVPSDYVRSVVSTDLESRISTISEEILSRSNLEKIISKFGLFSDPKYSGMFLEDIVAMLRKNINVNVGKRKRRRSDANAFSISFRGSEPKVVMNVTNGLADSFINENLKLRESQAIGTSDFIAGQLETTRLRLEGVERKLREYRQQNMGELPDQLDANLRILERLQIQLSDNEKGLRDEKSRLALVGGQIEDNRNILVQTGGNGAASEDGEVLSLEQLRAQLVTLKSTYTDRHPDVIKLKAKIADFEAGYRSGTVKTSADSASANTTDPAFRMVSNTVNELMRQRAEINGNIKNLELDNAKLRRQISEFQERVERTPKHEQELLALQRDYDNIQESYDSLLNRKLEAEISVNMEKKQKGEQFRIVDRAALPNSPISPNMRKLFVMSVAAGLGFGAGLIFLLDFLNTSLKQPKDYETELGLTLLAIIPKLVTPRDKMLRWINNAFTVCSLVVAAGLAGIFGLFILKGVDPVLKIASEYIKI